MKKDKQPILGSKNLELINKEIKWQKCLELAIYVAEQVLFLFEEEVPNNNSARKAIEAAKEYLKDPSEEKSFEAVEAANAVSSYFLARLGTDASIYSAYSAFYAVFGTIYRGSTRQDKICAYCAVDAINSAYKAIDTTDAKKLLAKKLSRKKLEDKINRWIIEHIDTLEEMK